VAAHPSPEKSEEWGTLSCALSRFSKAQGAPPAGLHSARSATGAAAKNTKAPGRRAVTKLRVVAELLFFRPLKRAGDVLASPQPQSRDWG